MIAQCPYCFHLNNVRRGVPLVETVELITCDQDDGGCDKRFIMQIEPRPPIIRTAQIGALAVARLGKPGSEPQEATQEPS